MGEPRGGLTIADRALTRIARQVTLEVPGVAAEEDSAGNVGRTLGRGYPRVRWQRAGTRARVEVEVAITWPASAAQVSSGVQAALHRELRRLAGQDLAHVSVAVREVVRPSSARPAARVQ
ncbi:Asp23/Gls24 family envelope stress response protein [Cellulomonas fengjieae]|uniref:Asp23/Gls24 family envelope stress response protein n=1 Tax=Cellulomonas fengjieae TaxID=2819978 RepID=A0ABS3SKA0_9CELL|nr:Asp23/Gls24 family envelope stress response protein [Cellulomonas fengjieae]MBO3086170.1 Asp23/Gls24 family envelope stress response protein [Cellulomonas fengjieae]MBO3102426.1 Asp23/Gls24 family envelope stress response protein [Cellulomonas fengjieae]QVI65771.1 Asp23/Gls24 family envelope stress response protein [Cellulomonas fengjieae]